ncbi:galactose-1-phosphate uridylyltransferase, partial [candidate division KSB1 bacterium]|nr:galactose-1-phosphate uridylyltransferase [candidate division KSB1 bacterium]
MSELTKDNIVGRWVIIATERGKRPSDWANEPSMKAGGLCPFCPGNEDKTPPEVYAVRPDGKSSANGPRWQLRVVPNKFPALGIEGNLDKRAQGIYDRMNGVGAHEVIIERPDHVATSTDLPDDHRAQIIWAYKQRLIDLARDIRFSYGMVFKNVGAAAGAS